MQLIQSLFFSCQLIYVINLHHTHNEGPSEGKTLFSLSLSHTIDVVSPFLFVSSFFCNLNSVEIKFLLF